ncbi:hypothetical protein AB1K91_06170 [Terribacillus sp. 179-K 1B1 HS]
MADCQHQQLHAWVIGSKNTNSLAENASKLFGGSYPNKHGYGV